MKQNILSIATLIAMSGLATAATDGFVVESAAHPHEDTKTKEHTVWVQKIADNKHTYELHMENGEMIVIVDGEQVPDHQIKDTGHTVVVLEDDGGVMFEFDIELDGMLNKSSHKPMVFMAHGEKDMKLGSHGNVMFVGEDEHPKVMLGIYTGEPGESLREHLGIKGDAVLVEKVIEGLSAQKAGIKDKDIIISIDGSDGLSPAGLTKLLAEHNPGDEIKLVVVRKGEKMKILTKLLAYDAEALGHKQLPGGGEWIGQDGGGNFQFAPNNKFFSKETRQLTHEKIIDALRDKGISEKKIAEIEEQIRDSLHENLWSNFGHDGHGGRIDLHVQSDGDDERHIFAEQMQRKAAEAMENAQRLTMEYKDGQLLLKRHAEGLESQLLELEERLHDSVPEIEEELHDRLGELEDRMNQLEEMIDSRIDRLGNLIESLIDRLEED